MGVSLSLRGAAIANDSYIDVDDIGGGNEDALLCQTNKIDCCHGNNAAISNWYFPSGFRVESIGYYIDMGHTSYFTRNRGNSVVRLLRSGAPTERGRFHCVVPNANDEMQTIYVNIGE